MTEFGSGSLSEHPISAFEIGYLRAIINRKKVPKLGFASETPSKFDNESQSRPTAKTNHSKTIENTSKKCYKFPFSWLKLLEKDKSHTIGQKKQQS